LANDWRRGDYRPWSEAEYVHAAADLVERTPADIVYHRLTGTASPQILLAPHWCRFKWRVLDGIAAELVRRNTHQGSALC
jgi:radical SAM superfamily enzyme